VAFKAGFLLRCVEEGLDKEAIANRLREGIKAANALSSLTSLGTDTIQKVWDTFQLLGIVGPTIAGAGGGYILAKMRNAADAKDIDVLRANALEQEYRRMADETKRKLEFKKLRGQGKGEIVQLY